MTRAEIICGSRDWSDWQYVKLHIAALEPPVTIISGGARGVDTFAWEAAEEFDCERILVPACWERFGKRAGPMRNDLMLQILEALPVDQRRVVGFRIGGEESRGTTHMLELATARGIPVRVYDRESNFSDGTTVGDIDPNEQETP